MAELFQIGFDLGGVDDVAVVGQGKRVLHAGEQEGLDVLRTAHVGGGITNMPDAVTPGHVIDFLLVEYFFYKASAFVEFKAAVRQNYRNAAALLAAMLEAL